MNIHQFRRFTEGADPVYQDNMAAPVSCGWWALPAGFERLAGNVPGKPGRRWITLSVPGDVQLYTGWDHRGNITRDGYFNDGPWQLMTADEASHGLHVMIARAKALQLSQPAFAGLSWKQLLNAANLQVFIPAHASVTPSRHLSSVR